VALSSIIGMVSSAASGSLADRIGLGRMLAIGLLLQAIGTGLLAIGGSIAEAAIAVAINGAGNSAAWPSMNGLVSNQVPPERRARAYALRFGLLNAGLGVGGIVSGSVVSLEHPGSFQLVYAVDAISTAAFAAIVVAGLRGTPGYLPDPRGIHPHEEAVPRGYRSVLADRRFLGFLACGLLFSTFGYGQLDGPWAAFATLVAHASPQVVGIGFAANTAVIVVLQLAVERATRRWRRSRMLLATGVLWSAGWLCSGLAALPALAGVPAGIALALSLGVFGLGETFYSPVNGALTNALAPAHLRGRYNALASSTWPLGGLIGPPVAGLLLGSALPVLWVPVIAVGTAVAGIGGLRLGRVLPADADRPPLEAAEAS
jgi:MFS family permease